MYCASCREERLSQATGCAVCGGRMVKRPNEAVLEELGHLRFLLADLNHWSPHDVPEQVQGWLRRRYRSRAEVLLGVLNGASDPAVAAPPRAVEGELERADVADVAHVDAAQLTAAQVQVEHASPEAERGAGSQDPTPVQVTAAVAELIAADERADVAEPSAPVEPRPSRWESVWRPFLYESVGWFVGGFLILAGAFYFVADGWASALTRSLVVFGVCAFYSLGFMLWSAFLRRRSALQSAGRVVGVIGAALAPFPVLALQPVAEASGALGGGLVWIWSVAAGLMVHNLAGALDRPARTPLGVAAFTSTLVIGFASALASFGAAAAWLPLVPLFCLWLISRRANERSAHVSALHPDAPPVTGEGTPSRAFSLLAPLYLGAAVAIRMGFALAAQDASPAAGTWAAMISLAVAAGLGALPRIAGRGASALEIAAVSVQGAALAGAVFGDPPAFFVCSAALAWTGWRLAREQAAAVPFVQSRLRWLYVTFFSGLLAWHSSGQLVPGYLKDLAAQLKTMLGHAAGDPFPFNFGAVFSLPYLIGGLVLAVRAVDRSAADASGARSRATGEILLRASAVLSLLIAVLAFCGSDLRAGLWSVPIAAALCLGLGVWTERRYLTFTGASLALAVPLYALGTAGPMGAAIAACVVAVTVAALSVLHLAVERRVLVLAALAASIGAFCAAVAAGALVPALLAAFAGLAVVAAARNHDEPALWCGGSAVVMASLTLAVWTQSPDHAPLALAVLALGAAAATLLGGRTRALVPVVVPAALLSAVVCAPHVWHPALPGVVLLTAAAAFALGARHFQWLHVPAAIIGLAALLPASEVFSPWPALTPAGSLALIAGIALASSVAAVKWGRSVGASSWAAGALLGLALTCGIAESSGLAVIAAVLALLTLRALPPVFTLPWAAALAFLGALEAQLTGLLGVAAALTAIAALDESAFLRRHLLGGDRAALPASNCAALFAIIAAVLASEGGAEPQALHLVALFALPLMWARTSRAWAFLLLPLPLVALGSLRFGDDTLRLLLPAALVLLTHGLARLPFGPERLRVRGQLALIGSGAATFAALLVETASPSVPLALAAMAALLLSSSKWAGPRLVLAALFVFFAPSFAWLFASVAVTVGFASHHLPWLARRVDPRWPAAAAVTAAAIACAVAPGELALLTLAGALFASTFLFGWRWLLPAAVALVALSPASDVASLATNRALSSLQARVALVALGAALLSLALTFERPRAFLARLIRRVTPWNEPSLRHPLWAASAALLGTLLLVTTLGQMWTMPAWLVASASLTALALLWTRQAPLAVGAAALLVVSTMFAVPVAWMPAVGAAMGAVLCLVAPRVLQAEAGRAVHHFGWVASLASLMLLRDLAHLATPLAAAFATVAVWVATRAGRGEALGWVAALAAMHVALLHTGLQLSTGRGGAYILPYLGAATFALCAAAVQWASSDVRRWVVLGLAFVGTAELAAATWLIPDVAPREAWVGGVALLGGCALLLREAIRWRDEVFAWSAQVLLIGAYVLGRHLGTDLSFGAGDSLVALIAGGIASGLNARLMKLSERWAALGRPLWGSGIVLPLLGLLAAPWEASGASSALLLAHAAHFSFLARYRPLRRVGAALAFLAFNGALVVGWLDTRVLEPQYFAIPSALAALVLVKVFESELSFTTAARLRAVAATVIHAAAAFRPLVFDSTVAMLACVAVCVVGIGAGVLTRVRSFVYLGTGFLVTTILANLIRHGVRDPRLGALFLSALGLLIIVFMVVLSARRADLVERYDKLRHTLGTWQG